MSQIIQFAEGLIPPIKKVVPDKDDDVTPNASGEINLTGGNNVTVTGDNVTHTLTVDVTGTTEHALQIGNATGSLTSLVVLTNGQLAIGSTGADPVPATLTGGNNIGITNAAGSITIDVDGTTNHSVQIGNATASLTSLAVGATAQVLKGNTGADPSWGAVDLTTDVTGILPVGSGGTGASSITAHAIPVGDGVNAVNEIAGGTDGQVLLAATSGDPSFATLTSTGGTILYTPGANTLNLETGASVATSYLTDDANSAVPALGVLTVAGGDNLNSKSSGSTVTLHLDKSISQPDTNAAGTEGMYSLGGNRFMHNYGTDNTFLGEYSGNLTMTGNDNTGLGSASLNSNSSGSMLTGVGYATLNANTTHEASTAVGFAALQLADADHNTAVGAFSLSRLVSGAANVGLGYRTGYNYTGAEDSNILIGNMVEGTAGDSGITRIGNGQDACFISGIYGVTPGGTKNMCIIDSNGQLGSQALPSSGGLTWSVATANTTMVADNGYITIHGTPATKLEYTLPTSCAVGKVLRIAGFTAGGWKVIQGAGQQIYFGNQATTSGAGGYLEFTDAKDCVELLCVVADTTYTVTSSIGNITIV